MIVECPGCQNRYDVTGRPPGTRARCRCGSIFELPHAERQAGQLACPQCGANVAVTNHACEFCSAQLLVKACPRCFAKLFHGSKHCSECGANSVVPAKADAEGTATQRVCPRCEKHNLVGRLVGDVLLDECPECTGVFVDTCALDRILSERQQARADAILGRAGTPTDPSATFKQKGPMYVRCPDCENMMNRVNFARSGVIVDVCKDHGTWFDAEELPKIVDHAMTGGIERSAKKDAANLLDDAKRQRQRAQTPIGGMGAGAAFDTDIHRSARSAGFFGGLIGGIASALID
jgi:Zn-finger nucleic acid-binding protein